MAKVTIEVDDEILKDIEALAAERGISASDLVAVIVADGVEMVRGAAMLRDRAGRGDRDAALAVLRKVPPADPLGVDTSDENAAIRQICESALSGRNKDAVKAEVETAERWFNRR